MLYVIRHGQTQLNNAHALQGRSDQPLNETGMAQARAAGEWLRRSGITFAHVFSSPLIRAVQTARLVAPGVQVTIDERLIEMDYGPYEGADLHAPTPELIEFFSDFVHNPAPEGMEQLDSVVRRTGAFACEVASLGGNILVSTHAIAMKGILEYLTPASQGSYWSRTWAIARCMSPITRRSRGAFRRSCPWISTWNRRAVRSGVTRVNLPLTKDQNRYGFTRAPS